MACRIAELTLNCMYPWFIVVAIVLILSLLVRDLVGAKPIVPVTKQEKVPPVKWSPKKPWTISIPLPEAPRSFAGKVKYLSRMLEDVLVNYKAGMDVLDKVIVKVGDKTMEFTQRGCFTPDRIVQHLIEAGLTEVFKAKIIDITLFE